jgi:hypothetical protein
VAALKDTQAELSRVQAELRKEGDELASEVVLLCAAVLCSACGRKLKECLLITNVFKRTYLKSHSRE